MFTAIQKFSEGSNFSSKKKQPSLPSQFTPDNYMQSHNLFWLFTSNLSTLTIDKCLCVALKGLYFHNYKSVREGNNKLNASENGTSTLFSKMADVFSATKPNSKNQTVKLIWYDCLCIYIIIWKSPILCLSIRSYLGYHVLHSLAQQSCKMYNGKHSAYLPRNSHYDVHII